MNSVTLSSANRSATACEQRDVLRALEDLKEQERTMYEIDNRKDQVMTVCKVALANLAMWVHDHYFPPSYAQATWKRLLPFFQLPGTITQDATLVQVELRPFNDRMLNRDLVILCDRVNQASPRLPDGRRLSFTIRSSGCILAAQKVGKIPWLPGKVSTPSSVDRGWSLLDSDTPIRVNALASGAITAKNESTPLPDKLVSETSSLMTSRRWGVQTGKRW